MAHQNILRVLFMITISILQLSSTVIAIRSLVPASSPASSSSPSQDLAYFWILLLMVTMATSLEFISLWFNFESCGPLFAILSLFLAPALKETAYIMMVFRMEHVYGGIGAVFAGRAIGYTFYKAMSISSNSTEFH